MTRTNATWHRISSKVVSFLDEGIGVSHWHCKSYRGEDDSHVNNKHCCDWWPPFRHCDHSLTYSLSAQIFFFWLHFHLFMRLHCFVWVSVDLRSKVNICREMILSLWLRAENDQWWISERGNFITSWLFYPLTRWCVTKDHGMCRDIHHELLW